MFHLEPVGRHMVEICTNLSCALVGAQRVVEAFESTLGIRAGETTEDGEITFRAVECLGGCGYAPVVAVDHRYRQHVKPEDAAAIVEELRADCLAIVLKGADERDLTKLDEYRAIGGYEALAKARAHDARRADRGDEQGEPARPRRRRLPDRPQGVADRRATRRSRSTWSSTPTSRSRAPSRTAR